MATGLEQKNAALKSLLVAAQALDATIAYAKIGDWTTASTWKFYTSSDVEVTSTPLTNMKNAFVLANTVVNASFSQVLNQASKAKVIIDGPLAYSASSGALTIAIKNQSGNDPSVTEPVYIDFEDTRLVFNAAHSLVIPSGATLGGANGRNIRVWVVVFNNAGTPTLGVINCAKINTTTVTTTNLVFIYPLINEQFSTTFAMGTSRDLAGEFVTDNALSSSQYKILGYFEILPQTTAGTWTTPTATKTYKQSTPLPGTILNTQGEVRNSFTTGTTTIPIDDTIPQSTEGNQYFAPSAFHLQSAANVVRVEADLLVYSSVMAAIIVALFRNSETDAFCSTVEQNPNDYRRMQIMHETILSYAYDDTSGLLIKLRAGLHTAGTMTLNGISSTDYLGRTLFSWVRITEIQG